MESIIIDIVKPLLTPEMIERLGMPFATMLMLMILFYMVINKIAAREFNKLALVIKDVGIQASKPLLTKEQMMNLLDITFEAHSLKKLEITRKTLEDNHIDDKERAEAIKVNIKNEFTRITQDECNKISQFTSDIGDVGKLVLASIDWKKFFTSYFDTFFNRASICTKINDIDMLMKSTVQDIKNFILEAYNNKQRSFEL